MIFFSCFFFNNMFYASKRNIFYAPKTYAIIEENIYNYRDLLK